MMSKVWDVLSFVLFPCGVNPAREITSTLCFRLVVVGPQVLLQYLNVCAGFSQTRSLTGQVIAPRVVQW